MKQIDLFKEICTKIDEVTDSVNNISKADFLQNEILIKRTKTRLRSIGKLANKIDNKIKKEYANEFEWWLFWMLQNLDIAINYEDPVLCDLIYGYVNVDKKGKRTKYPSLNDYINNFKLIWYAQFVYRGKGGPPPSIDYVRKQLKHNGLPVNKKSNGPDISYLLKNSSSWSSNAKSSGFRLIYTPMGNKR